MIAYEALEENTDIPEHIKAVITELVFPILEECRPNYDVYHAQAVAYWANEISRSQDAGINRNVLITAAYLHDIGYFKKFYLNS